MWILPKNIKDAYLSAQGLEVLSEELNEQTSQFEQSVTWKGKLSSAKTWLGAWKRVYWMKHLFGRILPLSIQDHFAEWWISSQEAIPASHLAQQETDLEPMIPDTYTRILNELCGLFGPSAAFSRTSAATLPSDLTLYTKAFDQWVMQLRQESIQRRKLARLMKGSDSLSLQCWPTPLVPNGGRSLPEQEMTPGRTVYKDGRKVQVDLSNAVRNWPTPVASAADQGENNPDKKRGQTLTGAARGQNWHTPTLRDSRISGTTENAIGRGLNQNLQIAAQVHQWGTPRVTTNNGMGKNRPDNKSRLEDQVHFPTPAARDWKSGKSNQHDKNSRPLNEVIIGPLDQDNPNTHGNPREQLNPAWVAELMGTTSEKIFFVLLEME